MATTLENFNIEQDALTIFYDFTADSEKYSEMLDNAFQQGEYLYINNQDPDSRFLYDKINKMTASGELNPFSCRRIIICCVMNLDFLSEDWIDKLLSGEKDLRRFIPMDSYTDHYYMIFLRFSVGALESISDQSRASKLIIKLGNAGKNIPISCQIYMMRNTVFDNNCRSHDRAMIQMLHLLSRKDYHLVLSPQRYPCLRSLHSIEYYSALVEKTNSELASLERWLTTEMDPSNEKLISMAKAELETTVMNFRKVEQSFRRNIEIFPVSIDYFEGNIFTGYRSVMTMNNPVMREIRNDYLQDKWNDILSSININNIKNLLQNEYQYLDYLNLSAKLNDGSLQYLVCHSVDSTYRKLAEQAFSSIASTISLNMPDYEQKYSKNLHFQRVLRAQLVSSGRYSGLQECFSQINHDIEPEHIRGMFASNVKTTALVAGQPASEWLLRNYEISGIQTAYKYPSIAPLEIMVIKEAFWMELDSSQPDTLEKMRLLY